MNGRETLNPVHLSIIIVTWNSGEDISRCLSSVLASTGTLPTEIFVVDNASSDGTSRIVRSKYPTVRLIELPENLGFPRANNVGIQEAQGEFVLLLNPDTEVSREAVHACIARIREDGKIGMIGCRILYPDGTLQLECAHHLPELRDVLIETFYLHMLFPKNRVFGRHRMGDWDHLDDRVVPRISGAFMMVRRAAIDQIGLLDERFFMYYEDVEYCARIARAGWTIQYLGKPTIIHFTGKSRAQSAIDFDYSLPLLRYTYFRENRGRVAAYGYRLLSLGQSLLRVLLSLLGAVLLAWNPGLKRRPAFRPEIHWGRVLWLLGLRSFEEVVRPTQEDARLRRIN